MGNFRLTDIGILSQWQAPSLPTISWTLKTGVSSYALSSVAYGDSVFIICTDRGCSVTNGYIRKTLDYGANWSDSRTGGNDTNACAYVGNTWITIVRCGEGSYNLVYSTNLKVGNTWTTKKTVSTYHYNIWNANNYGVIGAYNSYYSYSSDGQNWTTRRLEAIDSKSIRNAAYSSRNSLYYIQTDYNYKTYSMTALDGTGQAEVTALAGATYHISAGDNETLAFTYNSSSATAIKLDNTDGKTFGTTVTTLPTYNNIQGIKYYDGMYIMTYNNTADYTKHVALSRDGKTWTESTVPSWNATIYGSNSNIATGLIGSTHYIMIIASNSTSILIGTYAD